jgi:putative acetyltransferase
MQIVQAASEEEIAQVRRLFQEYWDSFGFTPCFQNFGRELAELPGKYAPPSGRLGLAWVDGHSAGCVALRQIDDGRCEAKRLYVKPEMRGQRLGAALLEWVIAQARAAGYREMLGDTMPVMQQALAMYDRMGFERTGPYAAEATEGAIYLRLKL